MLLMYNAVIDVSLMLWVTLVMLLNHVAWMIVALFMLLLFLMLEILMRSCIQQYENGLKLLSMVIF